MKLLLIAVTLAALVAANQHHASETAVLVSILSKYVVERVDLSDMLGLGQSNRRMRTCGSITEDSYGNGGGSIESDEAGVRHPFPI